MVKSCQLTMMMSCRGAASMVVDIMKIEEGSQNPISETILEIMISVVIFSLVCFFFIFGECLHLYFFFFLEAPNNGDCY